MIITFLLVFLGLVIYLSKDKTIFYLYLLYLLFVLKYVVTYIHIGAPPAINYAVFLLMAISVIPFFKKYSAFILIYITVFLLYFFAKYLLWGMSFFTSVAYYIMPFLLCLGALSMYEYNKTGKVKPQLLLKHLYIVFILQVLICWVQYLFPNIGNMMFIESYEWRGVTTVIKDFNVQDAIGFQNCGLMLSNVTAALFFAFAAVLLILYESTRSKRITLRQLFILIAAVPVCIMTGVRAPLFILLLILMIVVYKYERRYFSVSIIGMIGFYFLLTRVLVAGEMSGLGRIQEGFTTLLSNGDEGVLEGSTFKLSVMLIPYFIQNPIFGISLGDYKTPFGYSIGVNGFSTSDAQLLYTLCEIGIIGLLLYLYPYIKYLRILNAGGSKNGTKLFFFAVLLLSIVDLGLFLIDIAYIFVLGCVVLSAWDKQSLKKNSN